MANMMETGAAWLAGQLFNHAATSATYRRGTVDITIDVVRAETTAELNNEYGLKVDIRIADFLIKESDLVISAVATKPKKRDEIIITTGSETVTYEVLPEMTEDTYRDSDRFGNVFRVHTKETGRV